MTEAQLGELIERALNGDAKAVSDLNALVNKLKSTARKMTDSQLRDLIERLDSDAEAASEFNALVEELESTARKMTNAQLRDLIKRALDNDAGAVSDLIEAFRTRVASAVRKRLWSASREDREDANQDVIGHLWRGLRQISGPNIDHPWAYVMTVINNKVTDVGEKQSAIHNSEDLLDDWDDQRAPVCYDRIADIGAVEIIECWRASLDPQKREAGTVFLEAFRRGVPRRTVLCERYPDDETRQNAVAQCIYRGLQPGGFIRALGDALGEEGDEDA